MTIDVSGTAAQTSDFDEDTMLKQAKQYIDLVVNELPYPNLSPSDREDIAQAGWIKYWRARQEREIMHMKAYLRSIVRSEAITFMRQRKPVSQFTTSEDGELYLGNVMLEVSEGMDDPEQEFIEQEAFEDRLEELADEMKDLSSRQQHAAVCMLCERLDNLIPVIDALLARGINTNAQWPSNKDAKQLLQSSCYPARIKIAHRMDVDMSLYKKRKIAKNLCSPLE